MDVPLSLTRAELATICEGELGKIRSLVNGCLEEAATDAGSLAGAQAFGGGCRMPIVQDAIQDEVTFDGKLAEGGQAVNGCEGAAGARAWPRWPSSGARACGGSPVSSPRGSCWRLFT